MIGGAGRGALITVEGGEGGGKSTQVEALVRRLRADGHQAIATREPGGSEVAELLREALLSGRFEAFGVKTEALLFAAARIDHIDRTIEPALRNGITVVSDRFHDSTRVYQGALGASGAAFLQRLEAVTLGSLSPDLTLILDVPAPVGLARAAARRGAQAVPDRFERQTIEFHEDLRKAFQAIAAYEPDRCAVINADRTSNVVEQEIWDTVARRFALAGSSRATPIASRAI